ncbi:vinorine synthase-like [Sesamum indicum]|uniref:Vinorine synthase-like n=1 Tax=Sesamum indicum TaxID=4182 RepID=A0A6I9U508_SESIN|nr:vinorine synthase-like [Sesamum indicum]
MGDGVQEISRVIIKPSSETTGHPTNLKLSYLDQLIPSFYIPLIFFYKADESRGLTTSNHVQLCQQLKQSLSNTLTSFYPLAGRIEENFVVDSWNFGVEFIEARAHVQLMDVIQGPDTEDFKQYLPLDPTTGEARRLLVVKITFFDCGGVALGLCFSHKVADFTSIMAFANAWAATCRGETEFSRFIFNLDSYFPARDFPGSDFWGFLLSDENYVTKRFVFDEEKLAALKQEATSSSLKDPTRVELVSAFIWKHFMELAKSKNQEARKTFAAMHAVNLRARKFPPGLLENVFGNCLMSGLAFSDTNVTCDQYNSVEEYGDLVRKLRSSFKRISDDYIAEAQSGDRYLNDLYKLLSPVLKGELEYCSFSSWCRFPVYEVDYGWGNPIWLCTTALPLKNLTVLVNSRCGEGIEAWVNMQQDNLEMLETQIKLIPSTGLKDLDACGKRLQGKSSS